MIQTDTFENALSSPTKMADDANMGSQDNLSFTPLREPQGLDLEKDGFDDDFLPQDSSLSFIEQEQGGDCTEDLQVAKRQPTLDVKERSNTPRKRSFEHGPQDQDEEAALDGRFRKSASRREVPDINVYADEDASLGAERKDPESLGHGITNSMMEEKHEGMSTVLRENNNDSILDDKENEDLPRPDDSIIDDSHDLMDDTCLSTFSAVPNADMTSFAKLRGESPFKTARPLPSSPGKADETETRDLDPSTPPAARKSPRKGALLDMGSPIGSPTPKREHHTEGNVNETPNLLDLTDQQTFFPRKRYSMQNERYSPSRRSPLRTVRDQMRSSPKVSLLDFDIPAAPTPRSIPTVTPRELESLKSRFLSEISSLKATLSGREAEVSSLKQAVADAERRVGEALEEVRNEAAGKEALEIEQVEWQRRGQEMDNVLRSVRAEIVEGEREREQLIKRLEEAEKDKEQLESRMVELETQLKTARSSVSSNTSQDASGTKTAEETAKEVQDAVEKMAAELHVVYKKKHETKVSALKKSYEARWDKRVRGAEDKLKIVNEENERLRKERDAALSDASRPNPSTLAHENEEHEAEKRILQAQIKGLQQEMTALKDDSERLHNELRMERAEKGELVAAVDEWLAIQQNQFPSESPGPQDDDQPEAPSTETSTPNDFKRSLGRSGSSGIRPPSAGSSGPGEKRIPKIAGPGNRHVRGSSGGKSGIAVFTPGRSGIMGSIERMGRGGI